MNTMLELPQPEAVRLTPAPSRADVLLSVSPAVEEQLGRYIGAAGISYLSLNDPDIDSYGPNPSLKQIADFEGVVIQLGYTPPAVSHISRFAANLSLKAWEMDVPRATLLDASAYEYDTVRMRYTERLKAREKPEVTDILLPRDARFNPAVFQWWLGSIASRYAASL